MTTSAMTASDAASETPEGSSPESLDRLIEDAAECLERGEWDRALAITARVLRQDAEDVEAIVIEAIALAGLGKHDRAEEGLRRAIALDPAHPVAAWELARRLASTARRGEAAEVASRAWQGSPEDPRLAGLAAEMLHGAGRLEEAVAPARARAELSGDDLAARVRLAELLSILDRGEEAVAELDRVLARRPDLAQIRLARAVASLPAVPRDTHHAMQAVEALRRELERDEPDPTSGRELLGETGVAWPFLRAALMAPDPALARRFAARRGSDARPAGPARPRGRSRGERRRVGILAGTWRDHVVARLFLDGWTRHLDRGRFELIAIDCGRVRDAFGTAVASRCDGVIEGARPLRAWLETIARADLDAILLPEIGIDGMTAAIAAHRLAPVQAVAWGHPETTGLDSIDAFLSSEAMEPPEGDRHYAERLVPLPGLGTWVERPAMPRPNAATCDAGDSATRLWCVQSSHKLHPTHDRLLAAIAAAAPEARLLLADDPRPAASARLRRRLADAVASAGGDPARSLEFLPWLPTEELRRRLMTARVFLDPPAWSGGHTALEAVAAGVPIVTRPGGVMRQRHAFGILSILDPEGDLRRELVASDEEDFLRRTIRLAAEPRLAASLGTRLRERSHRLFEDPAPIRALEGWLLARIEARPAT